MESEQGKLFIGGISWMTTEERVKDYFSMFGEVREVEIKKDRITGRARGFGFVDFADPAVADKVLLESKHNIDGRMVEVKKAMSKDEQHSINITVGNRGQSQSQSIIVGNGDQSQSQSRAKKIFVGGLAPTVTEEDLIKHFGQFGRITNVVVMYDSRTQRSRGFGFVTYESEDAVHMVVQNRFHQLNGKAVEVKHSIPREQIPSGQFPACRGGNFGVSNVHGFNLTPVTPMNTGYSAATGGGGEFFSYGPTAYKAPHFGTGAGYRPYISGGGYGNSNSVNNTPSYGNSNSVNNALPIGNIATPSTGSNMWGVPGMAHGNTGSSVEYGGPGSERGGITHYWAAGASAPDQVDNGQPNGTISGWTSVTEIDYASGECNYAAQNNDYGMEVAPFSSASGEYGDVSRNMCGNSGHFR